MRKLKRIAIPILIIIAAYWLLKKLDVVPSLHDIFSPKPVVIDNTPILIREIKSIGELITFGLFDEVVVDSVIVSQRSLTAKALNAMSAFPILPGGEKKLVLICKGKVLAGVNLSLLTDTSIVTSHDTAWLHLPQAQLLDAIINPGDVETFAEKGTWTGDEANAVKLKAKRKIIEHALQQHILQKANDKARSVLENYLLNTGYNHVVITTR